MTHRTFAYELEQAADQIADVSRADLQIMLGAPPCGSGTRQACRSMPMSTRPSTFWRPR